MKWKINEMGGKKYRDHKGRNKNAEIVKTINLSDTLGNLKGILLTWLM